MPQKFMGIQKSKHTVIQELLYMVSAINGEIKVAIGTSPGWVHNLPGKFSKASHVSIMRRS